MKVFVQVSSDDLLDDFIEFPSTVHTERDALKIDSLPEMIEFSTVELDRLIRHLVAAQSELEQLREVALHDGVTCLHQVSHLEVVLKLDDDWDELLVQQSVFKNEILQGLRLEELYQFSDKIGDKGHPRISSLEDGVPQCSQMGQTLSCLRLYWT